MEAPPSKRKREAVNVTYEQQTSISENNTNNSTHTNTIHHNTHKTGKPTLVDEEEPDAVTGLRLELEAMQIENKRLREKLIYLQEMQQVLRKIFDTQETLLLLMDDESKILEFNQACQHATGYTRDEVVGKMFLQKGFLLTDEEFETVSNIFERLRTDNKMDAEFLLPGDKWKNYWKGKDGRLCLIKWSNSTIRDPVTGALKCVCSTGVLVDQMPRPSPKDDYLLRTAPAQTCPNSKSS